jgi:hypothetical protein
LRPPVAGILSLGGPGSLVGTDAAMRSRFHPPLAAHHPEQLVSIAAVQAGRARYLLGLTP